MRSAFLEYSYSVIYSRALPDARDGLKPVQRRILYGMSELGLRPDRPHVKSSRVVGEVMGKYHPHGDQAIYDALVRMAQPFTMRLPLVDGHGNFGSLDDGPAASRYTEARMAPAALLMVAGLDEDTVDYVPNYDDSLLQPGVMPAAYPNLLVNGASGIAVGMATNMAPHNLVEVIGAARHLIAHPDCSLDDLMRFVPGPDLPGGGRIIGLDGIRDAYLTGRGTFRTRAAARVEKLTPRRMGIVVTELPYLVGPEKVIERVKTLVQSKKLQGISDVKDLTDRKHGLRLVFEVKNGFNPDAVLEQLYKLTPMEDSFGINNVALVDGQPRTLGLKELLRHLRRLPDRGRAPPHRVPAPQAQGPPAPRRGPAHRDPRHRRGHPAHPHLRRRRRRARPAHLGVRPVRGPGRVHPRAPAAPADQVLPHRARDRARRARPPDRGARGDPRRREAAAPHRLRRARRRRQGPRHPAPHRAPRVGRHAGHVRDAARGRRRPVLGAALVHRPARPHLVRPTPCRRRAAGPSTTPSSVPCARRRGASSRSSPRPGGWCGCRRSSCRPCRRSAAPPACPAAPRSPSTSTCPPARSR